MKFDYKMIFSLLGGLGLFIYGMKLMGEGLQKAAGTKLKRILEVLTTNKVLGVLVGTGVTAIIQSSSATTVMIVGFVNAGLMDLYQAAGVIMGANIGTTMTAQLIAFNLTDIAPLVLAIGMIMVMFMKKKRTRDIGEIVLGFGILFVGMHMMETSMKPLSQMESFRNLIITLGRYPLMGVLVGFGMTATVQSSSATIGILQALASVNAISFPVALPILFGDNIGTCVTALLSSIGTNKNAKRAALIHLTFNLIGTIIFVSLLSLIVRIIPLFGGSTLRQIANAHTFFNVTNVIIQLPFAGFLVKFVNWLVPGKDKKSNILALEYLDRRLLETPYVAVEHLVKEVVRMGRAASENLTNAMNSLLSKEDRLINNIYEREGLINYLQREITSYMVALANINISEKESELVTSLFHVVNDIERVGDHAENLAELTQFRIENNLDFSEQATIELRYMYETVKYAIDTAVDALESFDPELGKQVIDAEIKIDSIEKQLRSDHIERLNRGICYPASGAVFLDAISNLERVGDHSTNIAQMVMGTK